MRVRGSQGCKWVGSVVMCIGMSLLLSACRLSLPGAASPETIEVTLQATSTQRPTTAAAAAPTQTQAAPVQVAQQVAQVKVSVPAAQAPACSLQTSWPAYTVQANDTLGQIAARTGSDVQTLAQANCLTDVNAISVGASLYVPALPQTVAPAQSAQVSQSQLSAASTGCTARVNQSTDLYNMYSGSGASSVAQLPANSTLPVNTIEFNGYVSLTYNGITGWADPRSVSLISAACANLVTADFNGCLLWANEEDDEFNVMSEPYSSQGLIRFPGQVWVYALAYRPYHAGESEYFGKKGWYRVRLPSGAEGWGPDFVHSKAGRCDLLSEF